MKKTSYSLIFRIAVFFHNIKTNTSKQKECNTKSIKRRENFSFGLDTHFQEKQKNILTAQVIV